MFSQHLKRIRIHSQKTQQQLAEYLHVSAQSISKWEKGLSMPSIEYLPRLAEFFNCSVDAFFSDYELNLFEQFIVLSDSEMLDFMIGVFKNNQAKAEACDKETTSNDESEFHIHIPIESLFLPALYDFLCANEFISLRSIQQALGVGYAISSDIIVALRNMGILEKSEGAFWKIKKDKLDLLLPYFNK